MILFKTLLVRILKIENLELSRSLTLMLKSLVIYLNYNLFFLNFGVHNVSFSTAFDQLLIDNQITYSASAAVFLWRLSFLVCGASILMNYRIRMSAFVISALIFLGVFLNRAFYSNNALFAGCLFFVSSLSNQKIGSKYIIIQLCIMYFGAAFDKAFSPQWRDGTFFLHWKGDSVILMFPGRFIGMYYTALVWSYFTIVLEFCLSLGIFFRKTRCLALHVAIIFHLSTVFFDGNFYGCFVICILLSYISFIEYKSDCNINLGEGVSPRYISMLKAFVPGCVVEMTGMKKGLIVHVSGYDIKGFSALQYILIRSPFAVLMAVLVFNHSVMTSMFLLVLACLIYCIFFPWRIFGRWIPSMS